MAAKHDLTPRIAPHLDRHLVFPLLEFLQEIALYAEGDILKAKIELLNHTNMVDYRSDDVPQDMVERRAEVVGRLKSLEDGAAPLVTFLQNPNAVQELRADKQYNLQMLNDRYQIGPEQIEALYQYAKFQFECGNYSWPADYLYQYRALCTNSDRSLSALWGKLAAEMLMQNWDIALEELNRLKEIIDSKNFSSPMNQVQSRIWLMHWSLFIFFNNDNGRTQIIDLFNQDRYLNAIQTNAPHLLRYLATAFIVNKRRRPQFKERKRSSSVGSCSSRKKRSFSAGSNSSAAIIGSNDDLLTEILIWLPAVSVIRFKTVSKHWLSLISDEFFARLHVQNHGRRPVETQQSFILMDKSHQPFLCRPAVKKLVQISLIPHSINEHIGIVHSMNGLVLLRLESPTEDRIDYVVSNPTTKQYRFIHLDKYRPLTVCILFDPSKSQHYKLFMRISKVPPRYSVYDSATRHWRHDLLIGDAFGVDMSGVLPHSLIVCSSMLLDPSLDYFYIFPQENVYRTNLVESNGYVNIVQLNHLSEVKKRYVRMGVMINREWVICKEATLDLSFVQCLGMIRGERVEDSAFILNTPGRILILRFSDDENVDLEVMLDYTSDYGQLIFKRSAPFQYTFASV